jgi:Legionella pneumophila major outer membrane protein precursor
MKFSRQFLLGLFALGVQSGLALALDPVAGPALNLPAPPAPPSLIATTPEPQVSLGNCPCAACCDPCHGAVFAGVGLYLMQPYFENNPAYNFLSETSVDGDVKAVAVDRVNVSQHLDVAPLIWLGYEGADGFGGRVRYWYFDQGTSQTATLAPFSGTTNNEPDNPAIENGTLLTLTSATPLGLQAFGDSLSMVTPQSASFTVTTQLEIQVLDVEAFQHFRSGTWDFLLSGGVRLAQVEQTYSAYDNQGNNPEEFRTLASRYYFQGAGPVLALEIRRALGRSGLTAYASARGSVVMGSAQQDASFGGPTLRNEDPNPQLASQHWDRGLPIGELEFGLEYSRKVGPLELVGQIALVGQDWFGAGNSSRSTPATPAGPTPNLVEGGIPVDSDITFFGLAVRLGVEY